MYFCRKDFFSIQNHCAKFESNKHNKINKEKTEQTEIETQKKTKQNKKKKKKQQKQKQRCANTFCVKTTTNTCP